jgi:hypothetical protein
MKIIFPSKAYDYSSKTLNSMIDKDLAITPISANNKAVQVRLVAAQPANATGLSQISNSMCLCLADCLGGTA